MSLPTELGTPGGLYPDGQGGYAFQPTDPNAQLRFPLSVPVYDRMRKTDGQAASVLRAVQLMILAAPWQLDTTGVDEGVETLVRTELGLPADGDSLARGVNHVVLSDHLREALTCLPFGFSCFEQVWEAGPPTGVETPTTGDGQVVHLHKLALRPASSIQAMSVDRGGMLTSVTQYDPDGRQVVIPISQLVVYSREREGADWTGVSIYRPAYKHWMIAERLSKLDAQIAERNGMGVPVITGVEGKEDQELAKKVAGQLRGGANAYAALPDRLKLQLVGVTGSTVDVLPKIQWHTQQISKSMLAQFLDLGHDNGAYSLGESQLRMFKESLQAEADAIAATFTEHVIHDLVTLNYGPDVPFPALTAGDLGSSGPVNATMLQLLAGAGLITPDATLEAAIRKRQGLPPADPATADPAAQVDPGKPAANVAADLQKQLQDVMDRQAQPGRDQAAPDAR